MARTAARLATQNVLLVCIGYLGFFAIGFEVILLGDSLICTGGHGAVVWVPNETSVVSAPAGVI
jgi:hypothetical protein